MSREDIAKAIAVTAELCGTELTATALRAMLADLSQYSDPQVLKSLERCRKECKRFTLADVIERIDDGRPGAEEAWGMCPRSEAESVVWTNEIIAAWSVALPLIERGESIAARQAFLEAYRKEVREARSTGCPVEWSPSLGWDVDQRKRVIEKAVERGLLPNRHPAVLLTHQTGG